MTKAIGEIDYIKGIAILLVFIGHAATPTFLPRPYSYEYIIQIIYSFHMALFFLISGFLSYKNIDIHSKENYLTFIKNKFYRLGIPFLTISLITNLMIIILKLLINKPLSNIGILDMIKTIFLYPENGLMGALWFLYTLFLISILSPIILRLPLNFTIILAFLLNIFMPKTIYFLSISRISFFLLYFIIGIYFRKYYYGSINFKNIHILKLLSLLSISVLCLLLYGYIVTNHIPVSTYVLNILNIFCGLSGIILILILLTNIKHIKHFNCLRLFGRYSMDIYLLSWFFQIVSMILTALILKISNYHVFFISNILLGSLCLPFSIYIIRRFKLLKFLLLGEYDKHSTKYTNKFDTLNSKLSQSA